jgi:L-alanine-DL-glutamate epimerase-like enolase superfamily enzyme
MRIDTINLYRITLPFNGYFSVSNAKRHSSTRIVLEVIADQGDITGYGECVPVTSVTGESPESVIKDVTFFVGEGVFPGKVEDVSQIWDFMDRLPDGKEHNATLCAMEMALLDALGKAQKRSVSAYLPQHFSTQRIHYGASITLGDRARIEQICGMIRSNGIRHLRIKMGSDFEQNKTAVETVREVVGPDSELRIDPNGVWDFGLAMRHLPLLTKHRVRIIEEPMARTSHGFTAFAEAVRSEGLTLMACESAPSLREVKTAIQEGYYTMFNVKLCRSGGFRRTLGIIDHLRRGKIPFQIGCTLGEAGLLSAAGRALGLACSDAVTYDGSYDRFVLKENIIEEDISFGPGGAAGPLDGYGLGVTVKSERLDRLCDFKTGLQIQ